MTYIYIYLANNPSTTAADNDWMFPQQVQIDEPSINLSTKQFYGFLNMHTGYFRHVAHTENEINELGTDVEALPPGDRRPMRLKHEETKWDEDYYM